MGHSSRPPYGDCLCLAQKSKPIPARGTLEGGRLLGGFTLPLARLFEPFEAKRKK